MRHLDVPTWTNSGGVILALLLVAIVCLAVRIVRDRRSRS